MIRELVANDHLPDYEVRLDDDMVTFINRETMQRQKKLDRASNNARISTDGYERAKLAAPGWDIYLIESQWRQWMKETPRDVDSAFVGFCKQWAAKRQP